LSSEFDCSNRATTFEIPNPPPPRAGIRWEWQEARPGGQFTNLPGTLNAAAYTVFPTAGKGGYRYRVEV
ncbi:MAG: hypothetical protein CRN43_19790, partial [Candidatus Nephrothrix sp. EaCA]